MATSSFGPSALATPANAITVARLALTPVFLAIVIGTAPSYAALGFWILLAGTDGVDGYLARRQGTTRSGAFLDPLADKFLVIGALVALALESVFSWVPVLIVVAREVLVSAYRSWVGRRGVSVPARFSAKVKTVVQLVAVGFALLPLSAEHAPWIADVVLWLGVALGVVSGVQYYVDARRGEHAM